MAKNEIDTSNLPSRKEAAGKKSGNQLTVLLTVEYDDGTNKEEVLKQLSDFGQVQEYKPETAATKAAGGPTHDAYGNPYNRDTKRDTSRDAYGNPYNPGETEQTPEPEAAPKGRDAYGNPY